MQERGKEIITSTEKSVEALKERKERYDRLKELEKEFKKNIAEIKTLKHKYKTVVKKIEALYEGLEKGTLTKRQIKAFQKLDKYVKM